MGKLAAAGIGIVIVVGGILWMNSGSSGGSSPRDSSYDSSTTSEYNGYDYSSNRPTYAPATQDNGPQVSGKDVYDGLDKAREGGWDAYKEYRERVPPIEDLPRPPVRVELPHVRVPAPHL